MEPLINWSTPEMVKNQSFDGNYINNPFDILELQASNMDPFDLVPEQTPLRTDPPCGIILSPLWDSKVSGIRKSMSLTDIYGVARLLEQNYIKHDKDDVVVDQPKDDCATSRCVKDEIIDQSIENNVSVHIGENKIENQEPSKELVSLRDQNEVYIEKNSYCNEQEKEEIRVQTRKRIEMLIEKGKKNYTDNLSRKSLFCTPQRSNTDSNLNKTINASVLNRGFIGSLNNINYNTSSKTPVSKENFKPFWYYFFV